jgi:hypothetical protein
MHVLTDPRNLADRTKFRVRVRVTLRSTVCQSVRLGVEPILNSIYIYIYIYIYYSVRISRETRHVSTTEPNRLMLFGETVAVHCENHTEHTDTGSGQNVFSFGVLKQMVHIVTTGLLPYP